MQSERFLTSTGIGNEVSLFVQPYEIEVQDPVEKRIKALASRDHDKEESSSLYGQNRRR